MKGVKAMRRNYIVSILLIIILSCFMISCQKKVTKEPINYQQAPQPKEKARPIEKEENWETDLVSPQPAEKSSIKEIGEFIDINFDFDKYELRLDAREILARHARILKEQTKIHLLIEGHCDEWGTVEYNLALGERRANAVRNYLINYGIDPLRISTISYGKEKPLDPRRTAEAWAKNRRATFVINNLSKNQ
ncbi:MAG: peptidoglycan-associated lipoprotein Pal [bacterium]|nr:peptidoglycan-associated lipoprotein Pal [bacterium]